MHGVKHVLPTGCLWLLTAACTPPAANPGTLDVQLSGGNGVEAPIPGTEFQDGWQLTLTQLLVVVVDLTVTSSVDSNLVGRDGRSVLVDLVPPGPHAWASMGVAPGAYDRTAFSIKPATSATVLLNASEADRQRMVDGGYSMLAVGSLTKGGITKAFAWGFQASTRYRTCVLSLKVVSNATTTTRYTLHGEQLFLESLSATASPRLRAQSQVDADANHDGTITTPELGAVDGGTFSALPYPDPGTFTFIHSLLEYEEQALLRSLRLPGEVRCTGIAVDSPLSKDGGA